MIFEYVSNAVYTTYVVYNISQKWNAWKQKVKKMKSKRMGTEGNYYGNEQTTKFETIYGGFSNEVLNV